MSSRLLLLISFLPALPALATSPGAEIAADNSRSIRPSTFMHSVSGSFSVNERQAQLTHLYSRVRDTRDGPVTAVVLSDRPLPEAALDDRRQLLQLAERGEVMAVTLEITAAGKPRQTELIYAKVPLMGGVTSHVDITADLIRGQLTTGGTKTLFKKTFAVDARFELLPAGRDAWSGSDLFRRQLAPIPAGRAEGWMERSGRRTELHHAVAIVETDLFGDRNQRKLLLSAKPVSDEMLATPSGPEQQLHDTGVEFLTIRIDDAGKVHLITVPTEDGMALTVSAGSVTAEFATISPSSADGYLELIEESPFKDKPRFQLRFHAPTHAVGTATPVTAETGQPLPQDGGEPGATYRTFLEILEKAQTLEELVPHRTGDMAAELADVPVEDRSMMLSFIKDQTTMSLQVVGGYAHETQATLWVEGRQEGARVLGRINLHREGDGWKIGAQAFRVSGS